MLSFRGFTHPESPSLKRSGSQNFNTNNNESTVDTTNANMPPSAQSIAQDNITVTKNVQRNTKNMSNGVQNGGGKVASLRESTQKFATQYRSEVGEKTAEEFLASSHSVESFFDFVAGIRLRQMPTHGSRWDRVLRWAEFFAGQVAAYADELKHFVDYTEQVAAIIWACCRALLQLGTKHIAMLEKVFGTFYSAGLLLTFFIRHHEMLHSVEELQVVMAATFSELFSLVTGVTIYYGRRPPNGNFSARTFDEIFSKSISSYYSYGDRFADGIWAYRLRSLVQNGDVSVELVREFLSPRDKVTRTLSATRNTRKIRADLTCEWFDPHLTNFIRNGKSVFVVQGKPCSGKSVLSEWTTECLQTTKGRRVTDVIAYKIDSDLKTEISTMSILKGLLLQLLQLSVGDSGLYKQLLAAYDLSIKGASKSHIETALWQALESGLSSDRSQTVIIDGIDQIQGGESQGLLLLEKLQSVAAKQPKTKVVVFSRPFSKAFPQDKYTSFSIEKQHTYQDLQYFAQSILATTHGFESLNQREKLEITTKLAQESQGSYGWISQLVVSITMSDGAASDLMTKLQSAPKTLSELLETTVKSIDLHSRDTKSILAFLLAAQRPLLVQEVKALLEIDVANVTRVPRTTRTVDDVLKACWPLVDVRDGFVRFRNSVVRQFVTDQAIKVTNFKNAKDAPFPFALPEAHYDLTLRLLAYAKIVLTRPELPTLTPFSTYEINEVFDSYELLQYATTYWVFHFTNSPMYDLKGQYKVTQGFKTVLPASTLFAIMEWRCYEFQLHPQEIVDVFKVSLALRKTVFGEMSECVLQNLIYLAKITQTVLNTNESNEYYWQIWQLASSLKLTEISTTVAETYIKLTSTITTAEIITRRTTLLTYIITIYKETRVSNQETIVYMEILATIYLTTGHTEKASLLYKEIYELKVQFYGKTSIEAQKSYEILRTTRRTTSKKTTVDQKLEYEIASRTLEASDNKRINLTWKTFEAYESSNDIVKAEATIVELWTSLSSVKYINDIRVQQERYKVALRYVDFLKWHQRNVEAEAILRGLWQDMDHQDQKSREILLEKHGKVIGDQLQSVGSLTAARTIYQKLIKWWQSTGNTTELQTVSKSLEETNKKTTTETTYETVTIREIYETTITRARTTKTVDTTTITMALNLSKTYISEQKWQEVITTVTEILTIMWSGFTSQSYDTPLPKDHYAEICQLIERLTLSYTRLNRIESLETVLKRHFYGVRATPKSSDDLLFSTFRVLIEFYEIHGMYDKTITTYKDLVLELQKRHGKTDPIVIKYLYTLGDQSTKLRDVQNSEFAYNEIHSSLIQNGMAHRDAIKAALALATVYDQQHKHKEATKVYASLWTMFLKHGQEYDLKPEFAESLYQKYSRAIKQDSKTDHNVLRHLAIEYKKALVRFYGVSHDATLRAALQIGQMSEEYDSYREDAIDMYEEADKKTRDIPKGQIPESTLTAIAGARQRLPLLYSKSKLSTSPRAIPYYQQEHQANHSKHGHAHRESLFWLSLLAAAHTKQGSKEITIKTLQATVYEILSKEKGMQQIADSASTLADVYVKSGHKLEAEEICRQLRAEIVFGDSDLRKALNLTKDAKLDRRTWVFLTVFETSLKDQRAVYSSYMANLTNEVLLYKSYLNSVARKDQFLDVLAHGSRLLSFLGDIGDDYAYPRVYREVVDYFKVSLNLPKSVGVPVLREFFQVVLSDIYKEDADTSVLQSGSAAAISYLEKGKVQEGYETALMCHAWQQVYGGYKDIAKVDLALKLSGALAGRGTKQAPQQNLATSMLSLSSTILTQVFVAIRTMKLSIAGFPLKKINEVSWILGAQGNLADLEWVLQQLWDARHSHQEWSSAVVVQIGRRLAETQYAAGHHDEAITFCEDMCYNLRRVWGTLDTTTLSMHELLSSFYSSSGHFAKAMHLHEDILRDTVSEKADEFGANDVAQVAARHLDLLKRSYQRLGKWDKEPQIYVDLFHQIQHVFSGEDAWKSAQQESIQKWQAKGADSLGLWIKPASFEFMPEEVEKGKHRNYLRKSSGTWAVAGHFHGNMSRTYSSKSIST